MSDEADVPLTPAQRSKIRRLSAPKEVDMADEAGELNIVPFLDIIMNVLMFVLATIPAVFTVTIETNPPSMGGKGSVSAQEKPTLNLSLVIVAEGVSLKTRGGNIAPGCEGAGTGVTVPKKNGEYDWPAVGLCARKLKEASPDFKEEDTVQILADSAISYKSIIAAMDSVRKTAEGDDLFPEVNFGVVK